MTTLSSNKITTYFIGKPYDILKAEVIKDLENHNFQLAYYKYLNDEVSMILFETPEGIQGIFKDFLVKNPVNGYSCKTIEYNNGNIYLDTIRINPERYKQYQKFLALAKRI